MSLHVTCSRRAWRPFWAPVEQQARAVAGLMRTGTLPEATPGVRASREVPAPAEVSARSVAPLPPETVDPRLRVFSELEQLSLAQKVSFFS